jgi:hypothetical protein
LAERLQATLAPDGIDKLIRALTGRGYQVLGPTVRDGAIVYDKIEGADDLPRGWTDEQGPGHYRLKERQDGALFGYGSGPQSWKKYLHPPELRLFAADGQDGLFRILDSTAPPAPPMAFVGVRACELAAIGIQDRALLEGKFRDSGYGSRRDRAFIVAVQCTQAAATCFCASMRTGPEGINPEVRAKADLTLTEVVNAESHWFLAEADSKRGREVLAGTRWPARHRRGDRACPERRRICRNATGPAHGDSWNPRPSLSELRASALGRDCRALSFLRQLHHGVPHLFLHQRRRRQRRHGTSRRTLAPVGLLLHHELFLHPRRQCADLGQGKIPPVDDSQISILDRPVRDHRLRRVWKMYRLVSGWNRSDRRSASTARSGK